MIEGNDGGANVSYNGGQTWSEQDYRRRRSSTTSPSTTHFPYSVCGAQQDNSHALRTEPRRTAASRIARLVRRRRRRDAATSRANPDDPDIMFAGSYGGYLTR